MWAKNIIRVEMNRQWSLLKRYPLQTLANALSLTFVSVAAWIGLRAAFFTDEGFEAVTGVLLWPLVLAGLGIASTSLELDKALGTIEQLYTSSSSMLSVIHCRAVSYLFYTTLFSLPLWAMGAYFLGVLPLLKWLLQVGIPLMLAIYGIGLVIGGMTLLFRQTSQLVNLLALLLMVVMVLQVSWPPGWPGFLLRSSLPMVSVSLTVNIPTGEVLVSYLVSFLYLLTGQIVFRLAEGKAKRLGLIGHY